MMCSIIIDNLVDARLAVLHNNLVYKTKDNKIVHERSKYFN